jgi:hypothetical protein
LRNHALDIAAMDLFVVPTIGFDLLYAFVIVRLADSDQFARLFRSHLAQDSEMISPRVPISNRPGTRFFQHVSFWHR